MDIEPSEFVQILNKSDYHWFTISTVGCKPGVVNIYDSASKHTVYRNKEEIAAILNTSRLSHPTVHECAASVWWV